MKTLEEAIENQIKVHKALNGSEKNKEELSRNLTRNWRTASLKDCYELKADILHGTGKYPVCKCCGTVCQCNMEWFENETILLCTRCFIDGT